MITSLISLSTQRQRYPGLLLVLLLATFLLSFSLHGQANAESTQVRYRLPDDPSWEKRRSGKHKMQHSFDLAASRHAIFKKKTYFINEFTYVGMAISRDGTVGQAALKNVPFSRCGTYSTEKRACMLTVSKGKVRREFAFHPESSGELVIDDMIGFVDFVDAPERFTISYLGEKGARVSINF